jgi:3-carboxy-cis,cis-muconate cycloisomerase
VLSGELLTRLSVILAGLELDAVRMRHNLDLTEGLISSERVMLALGGVVGRQEAHELIRAAASRSVADAVPFADVLAQDPRIAGVLGASAIAALLDPTTELGLSTDMSHEAAGRARDMAADLPRDPR